MVSRIYIPIKYSIVIGQSNEFEELVSIII